MGLLQIKIHVVFYNSKDYGILDNLFLKEVADYYSNFLSSEFQGGGGKMRTSYMRGLKVIK